MLDLDASNLRDWLATVGLLRVTSDVTNAATLHWRSNHGRYRPQIMDAPQDLAELCAGWVEDHKSAWQFADLQNVNFGPQVWRENAAHATDIMNRYDPVNIPERRHRFFEGFGLALSITASLASAVQSPSGAS